MRQANNVRVGSAIAFSLSVLLFCATANKSSERDGLCVCEAARLRSSNNVTVRGTGSFVRDQAYLFDFGCQVAKLKSGRPWPTMIMLENFSFASNEVKEKYHSFDASLDPPILAMPFTS
jgi:hypothetical protein